MPSIKDMKKKSKNSFRETEGSSSLSLQMELELNALRTKNLDLTKLNTKLTQDNAEMRSQIYSLQADLLQMQSKFNSVQSAFTNLTENMKSCTPNLVNILNLFLDVTGNCQRYNSISFSEKSITSRQSKAITHAVQPHTVNGTVLNLNPRVSLTRLSTTNTTTTESTVVSNNHTNGDVCIPSTSYSNENYNDTDNFEVDENVSVTRRNERSDYLSREPPNDDDMEGTSRETSEFLDQLSVIPEESYFSEINQQSRFSEIRICLSPLSARDIEKSLNRTCSSTTANVNDTHLNVETTVVENTDNVGRQRMQTDIMIFSPRTNSTRMEYEASFCEPTTVDEIQRLPTPTLSALGDIKREDLSGSRSKLEVFRELSHTRNISPISPLVDSELRQLRSSKSLKSDSEKESPKSSRNSSSNKIRNKYSINTQRPRTQEFTKSPTIILEKMDFAISRLSKNSLSSKDSMERKRRKNIENKFKKLKVDSRSSIETNKNSVPSSPESVSSESSGRPKRAARPKDLKDASLKVKLRRMV
ncbi:uncharacterized protein LOC115879229 [Sitophilus oryzae]|uniref:Uncharacterized protein LOC115879229 n=1 Tax=Sitophilus oryzae TaxID=7048 RepID=A0A6J2XL28_SITOR|nr:uncharacterized protein LOC115879229 [Sitophilus oryzae]